MSGLALNDQVDTEHQTVGESPWDAQNLPMEHSSLLAIMCVEVYGCCSVWKLVLDLEVLKKGGLVMVLERNKTKALTSEQKNCPSMYDLEVAKEIIQGELLDMFALQLAWLKDHELLGYYLAWIIEEFSLQSGYLNSQATVWMFYALQ